MSLNGAEKFRRGHPDLGREIQVGIKGAQFRLIFAICSNRHCRTLTGSRTVIAEDLEIPASKIIHLSLQRQEDTHECIYSRD